MANKTMANKIENLEKKVLGLKLDKRDLEENLKKAYSIYERFLSPFFYGMVLGVIVAIIIFIFGKGIMFIFK